MEGYGSSNDKWDLRKDTALQPEPDSWGKMGKGKINGHYRVKEDSFFYIEKMFGWQPKLYIVYKSRKGKALVRDNAWRVLDVS